jgi:hypothetical protein
MPPVTNYFLSDCEPSCAPEPCCEPPEPLEPDEVGCELDDPDCPDPCGCGFFGVHIVILFVQSSPTCTGHGYVGSRLLFSIASPHFKRFLVQKISKVMTPRPNEISEVQLARCAPLSHFCSVCFFNRIRASMAYWKKRNEMSIETSAKPKQSHAVIRTPRHRAGFVVNC